jgi:predicted Zn-dependent protease
VRALQLGSLVLIVIAGLPIVESRAQDQPPDQGKGLLSQFTQPDPVTGLPTINRFSLKDEVDVGREIEIATLEKERASGFSIDADQQGQSRIERVLKSLTPVCHLPSLPWRFHLSSNPGWNAFATMGGFVLVLKGLLDDVSDTELAAILGHEIAHITCRHMSERITHEQITSLVSERARSIYYKASYSTECEAEADKVGVLYMALAGYDPQEAHNIWERVNRREGSNPGNYTFTHPLNKDRAAATRQWGAIAAKYYEGPGKANSHLGEVLQDNELVPHSGSSGSEAVDFISAALLETLKYRKSKQEAKEREEAADATRLRKQAAAKLVKINRVFVGKSLKGKQGVYALVQNGSNALMKRVELQFYYKTLKGTWAPYQEKVLLENLRSGEERSWGLEFDKAEHARWEFSASVIDLDW